MFGLDARVRPRVVVTGVNGSNPNIVYYSTNTLFLNDLHIGFTVWPERGLIKPVSLTS